MNNNNDERKRKRDEHLLSVAWLHCGDTLMENGIDQQSFRDRAIQINITDGATDESIKTRVFQDIVFPTMKRKNEHLEEKNEHLEEKNEHLEEKTEQLTKKLEERSIVQLIRFHQDEIDEGRENLQMLSGSGSANSSLYPKRAKATSGEANFEIDLISYHDSEIDLKPSCLLALDRPFGYYVEAEVQAIVGNLLNDAVKYVNWASKSVLNPSTKGCFCSSLTTRIQQSIFSNRPDHFVVYNSDTDIMPVLNVEVLQPYSEVSSKSIVHGQIFDYLMTEKLQHGKSTFGIVTTFTKTKVVWLPDESSNSKAPKQGRMEKENLEAVFEGIRPEDFRMDATPDTNTLSPSQFKKVSSSTPNFTRVCEINQSIATYEPHQLFTVLCNAIVASISARWETLKIFDENFEANGKLPSGLVALVVTKDPMYKWIKLDRDIEVKKVWTNSGCQGREVNAFYIVQYLGVGRTSRVWRAIARMPSNAKKPQWAACVIKYWVLIHDLETNQGLKETAVKKLSDKSTKKELKNYRAIYEDLESLVGRVNLCGRWCMILPFFTILDIEERKKESAEIKEVLMTRFYNEDTKVSYRFKERDQCWQHIGKRGSKIYIFDLGDLIVETVDMKTHEGYVNIHMANLANRLTTEVELHGGR